METIERSIQYYSSDFNIRLIFTERDGSITQSFSDGVFHTFKADTLRKDAKFYPADDYVFTTTDVKGLRVWDAHRSKCIYSYKEESLTTHSYSSSGILAAFDDYNVKFYDLRCRYTIGQLQRSNSRELMWNGSMLYIYDGDSLECVEYPQHRTCWSIKNVKKFATVGQKLYAIQKDRLVCIDSMNGEHNTVSKRCSYGTIRGVKDTEFIAGLEKGCLFFESHDGRKAVPLDKPRAILNAVYKISGKYAIFIDNKLRFVEEADIKEYNSKMIEDYE